MNTLGTPQSVAIGTWVKIASSVSFEIIARSGFDFVVLDLEHGLLPLEWVHDACAIGQARGLTMLVRLPNASGAEISRILDMDADGILVPQLRSAEQARALMRAALFPPRGTRGAGPTTRAGRWGLLDRKQYLSRETIHCIQFETIDSFEQVSQILDVDGVNAALLGRVDLAVSLGVPDTDPRLGALSQLLLAETHQRGIACGTAVGSTTAVRQAIEEGFDFVVVSNDASVLAHAMADLAAVDATRPASVGSTPHHGRG